MLQELGAGRISDPADGDLLVKDVLAQMRAHNVSQEVVENTFLRLLLAMQAAQMAQPAPKQQCGCETEAGYDDAQYQAANTHQTQPEGITATSLATMRDQLARVSASLTAVATECSALKVKL